MALLSENRSKGRLRPARFFFKRITYYNSSVGINVLSQFTLLIQDRLGTKFMALKYFFFTVLNIRAMEAVKDELLRNPALDRQYSCQEHNQTSVPNLLVQTNLLCLM